MPLILSALIGALVAAAGSLVGQVLISLGLGYFSYSLIDTSIGWAKSYAVSNLQSLGGFPNAMAVMATLHIGSCISILCSALVVRMTLKGMTSGVVKRIAVK